jgi:hypothetical protein
MKVLQPLAHLKIKIKINIDFGDSPSAKNFSSSLY